MRNSEKSFNKIRQIKLNSAILSEQLFAGNFLSIFSGQGMNFKELREYNLGDDVKSIDWSASAKTNKTYVKVNEEERQQHIVFLLDVSKSIEFGYEENSRLIKNKKDVIAELCFTLAYSSIKNNDKIGAVFFSNKIEKVIPISNNSNTISIITKYLFDEQPQFDKTNNGTDLRKALNFAISAFKKDTIIFIFSDFFTNLDFEKELAIAAKKFKLIAFQITDKNEKIKQDIGLMKIFNKETNKLEFIEVSESSKVVENVHSKQMELEKMMKKNNILFTGFEITENYFLKLKHLFMQKIKK